jgi:hypothetical protein
MATAESDGFSSMTPRTRKKTAVREVSVQQISAALLRVPLRRAILLRCGARGAAMMSCADGKDNDYDGCALGDDEEKLSASTAETVHQRRALRRYKGVCLCDLETGPR